MMKQKNVTVVVLGDIGRSPRMQYHALSLAKSRHIVDVIGYGETDPMDDLKTEPLVFYHYLLSPPRLPIRLVNYAFKTIWQAFNLLFLLLITRRTEVLLVQNPPAVPSLVVCWMYCRIFGAKLVIDWHNYAHTIMAMSAGQRNPLVWMTKRVEECIGKRADANLCVTNAMRNDLLVKWNIEATTLYDRPPSIFRPISLGEKHNFLLTLAHKYKELLGKDGSSIFTEILDGEVQPKLTRPGLIVSSTSWTEDEDFSILFEALQAYENHHEQGNQQDLPKLVCVITGKGPMKKYYTKKISEQKWKHITVITPWLEPKEYPLMLASADLGVSLHISSSGLDLPMKVVDMFGCELPVCAFDFQCIQELVKDGENGYTFTTPEELAKQIQDWFEGFPAKDAKKDIKEKFKKELRLFQNVRWELNWNNVARRIFE